jgi:hypothetical protein
LPSCPRSAVVLRCCPASAFLGLGFLLLAVLLLLLRGVLVLDVQHLALLVHPRSSSSVSPPKQYIYNNINHPKLIKTLFRSVK